MAREVIAGRYRLDERIGVGGMAEVWAAHDLELDRRVAIKLLGPQADPARFEREARAIAGLAHPNICGLYDYGASDGRRYMVLEYLPGGTLEDRLPRTPLPDEDTLRIASEIASGLAQAHARGLVHRDLKPANVLFDEEGRAKIADFGIAHIGEGATLTEAGTMLGTAAYISPEQASGEPAGPPSDVYSFGVILYRMLSGRLPFEGSHPLELASKHVNEEPPPLASVRPDAPPLLAGLAEAALAKDPARRPPDGAALVDTLAGSPTEVTFAIPEERTQVIRRPPRRAPRRSPYLIPFLVAAGLLALGGVALALVLTDNHARQPAAPSSQRSSSRSSTQMLTPPPPPAPVTSTTTNSSTASTPSLPTLPAPPPQPPPQPPPPPPTTSTTVPTVTTVPSLPTTTGP